MQKLILFISLLFFGGNLFAQTEIAKLKEKAAATADKIEAKCIEWRRDFHLHPELGNSETRTAAIIAAHLKKLGIETKEGVGKTGVVGILKGGKPGPCIALRADTDALPIVERVNIPFASKVKTTYNGQDVGAMHACGHDTHTAMLMSVAEINEAADNAKAGGASRMCLGAAWREVRDNKDFDKVLDMVKTINSKGMEVCATLGMVTEDEGCSIAQIANLCNKRKVIYYALNFKYKLFETNKDTTPRNDLPRLIVICANNH